MNKLIIIFIMLMPLSVFGTRTDYIQTKVICEEGYKFLIVYVWGDKNENGSIRSPSVVQMYEINRQISLPPRPMRCK